MILPNTRVSIGPDDIEFLLAQTVPSDPRPQNIARWTPAGSAEKSASHSRLVNVTSSTMPTVKWFLGFSALRLSSTARHIPAYRHMSARAG